MKSIQIRIPKPDYEEIKKISDRLNIGIGPAYQIWKKMKMGGDKLWEKL